MDEIPPTKHTLIRRACDPSNETAWCEFFGQYARFIHHVLRQMDVHPDEIEDLAQQILVTLTRDIPGYDRDKGRFRGWLSAVIRHAALSHLAKQRNQKRHLAQYAATCVTSQRDSLHESEVERMIEEEWAAYVGNLAMARVREAFHGGAVAAYEMFLDGLPAAEIATRTGLEISSVYTLRKRVKRRLYLEIRAITAELEPSPPA